MPKQWPTRPFKVIFADGSFAVVDASSRYAATQKAKPLSMMTTVEAIPITSSEASRLEKMIGRENHYLGRENPMPKLKTERWAMSQSELEEPDGLNSNDELIADLGGGEGIGIIVYRNGKVSNRYSDGIIGISMEEVEAAREIETLYHPDYEEETFGWYDVKVNSKGDFVKFVGERRPLFR